MNLSPAMSRFYQAIADDARISSTHISIYMALLHCANLSGGKNPVAFKRQQIMHSAKISARHTYNKCMNELSCYGYISYAPSRNKYSNSYAVLHAVEVEEGE